ncbi:MAG: lysine--tRNA ligase [Puniceicoccales bacterium]|jgi:lysyl-tRNA synthetase class 2|nr:lysine--tRNA ligase [Puniceicoccales bacterium]
MSDKVSDLFPIRKAKFDTLCASGQNPFQANCKQTHTAKSVQELFEKAEQQTDLKVAVAGRIVLFRLMGKASFINLLDQTGIMQVYVSQDGVREAVYQQFKKLDIGDFVGVSGSVFRTKTGEITVRASSIALVSKSFRPLPEKWHGLTDPDAVYRQRYLDLIVNPESRKRFFKRSDIIRGIRQFLWDKDFIEVETPMLHDVAGGAVARPFVTHVNALNRDFFLRISLELYLKRMLVGGYDRVFEIGRNFRNEGVSRRHNPEFTMMELYQAYSDYRGMMELVYDLIQHLCQNVIGKTSLRSYTGEAIELSGAWREVTYRTLILEEVHVEHWFESSREVKLQKCAEMGIEVDPHAEDFELTNGIFEKRVVPRLIQPTFVTHLPKELCPLAKINREDDSVIDVFELYMNGQEIAPAYSEQNDPFVQRRMFEMQAGEEIQKIDNDFLTALEYGMPPAGGMGIGIDRLVIVLTEADSIRDTLLYPALK